MVDSPEFVPTLRRCFPTGATNLDEMLLGEHRMRLRDLVAVDIEARRQLAPTG